MANVAEGPEILGLVAPLPCVVLHVVHLKVTRICWISAELTPATTTFTPLSGITPREMIITERVTPPGMVFGERDFHAAVTQLMKPRRLP